MQPARERFVTFLHRIQVVLSHAPESADAGFEHFCAADSGQGPMVPAGSIPLISNSGMPGEGFTTWGGPPPPSIRRSRISGTPTKAAIA
jgi:hypothetical protein